MLQSTLPSWIFWILPPVLGGSFYALAFISSNFEAEIFAWVVVGWQVFRAFTLLLLAQAILYWQKQQNPDRVPHWQSFLFIWMVIVLVHLGMYVALKSYLISYQPQSDSIGLWHLSQTLAEGIITALIITGLLFLFEYINQWQNEQVRAAQLAKENAQSQFAALKWQLNPHLMFNNLNTLYGLIDEDTEQARRFLLKFSNLYRSILNRAKENLIDLKDELQVVEDFNFLIQQRYGKAYQCELQLTAAIQEGSVIPPLTLQTLLENVVKHNRIDDDHPMHVSISEKEDWILVKNTVQAKLEPPKPGGVGLQNLQKRYQLLSNRAIQIEQRSDTFLVRLPNLKVQPV
ncbi:MAG: histidine kinase [Bacteroidota bacterium]